MNKPAAAAKYLRELGVYHTREGYQESPGRRGNLLFLADYLCIIRHGHTMFTEDFRRYRYSWRVREDYSQDTFELSVRDRIILKKIARVFGHSSSSFLSVIIRMKGWVWDLSSGPWYRRNDSGKITPELRIKYSVKYTKKPFKMNAIFGKLVDWSRDKMMLFSEPKYVPLFKKPTWNYKYSGNTLGYDCRSYVEYD